jgi:hypothetical protein
MLSVRPEVILAPLLSLHPANFIPNFISAGSSVVPDTLMDLFFDRDIRYSLW